MILKKLLEKYYLDSSIIALFFKDQKQLKVLSKIRILKIRNSFKIIYFKILILNEAKDLNKLINELKIIYEDFWKENNLINTSIKLPLLIKIE